MPGEDRIAIAEAVNDPNGEAAGRYRVENVGGIPVTFVNLGGREVRLPYTDPTNRADYPVPTQFNENVPVGRPIRMNPAYAARVVATEYATANNLDLSPEEFDRFASQFNIEEMFRSNPDALRAALDNDELAPMLIRSFQLGGSGVGLTGQQDTPFRYSIPQVQPDGAITSIDQMSDQGPGLLQKAVLTGAAGVGAAGGAMLPSLTSSGRPSRADTTRVQTANNMAQRLRRDLTRDNMLEFADDLDSRVVRQTGQAPSLLSDVMRADFEGADNFEELYRKLYGGQGRLPGRDRRMTGYRTMLENTADRIALGAPSFGPPSRFRRPAYRTGLGALGAVGLPLSLYYGMDEDPISAQDAMDRALSDSRPSSGGLFTGPDSPFGAPYTGRFSGNIMDIYGINQPQQR